MLFLQLDLWSRSVSTKVFNTILDDVASALADWKDNTTDQADNVLAGFHDFASKKREGFDDFQRSRQYSRLWNSVDHVAKNRAHNQAKRENAERKVRERWGYNGTTFMRLNPAIQWGVKVRKLSELVGDYDTAMTYINRAIYTKRINSTDAYGNEFSPVPGGADIVRARVLAERPGRTYALGGRARCGRATLLATHRREWSSIVWKAPRCDRSKYRCSYHLSELIVLRVLDR